MLKLIVLSGLSAALLKIKTVAPTYVLSLCVSVSSSRTQDPSRPLFVVQIPNVSMAASNWLPGHDTPPAPSHVAQSLQHAFEAQGHHHGALFLAHSYGSTYANFALQFCPEIVRGCVLVEPASMLCHLPKMTKSFMYTLGAEGWKSPLSVMFRLEPHVAVSLRRHFGMQNLMFLTDLKGVCPGAVLVSKGDTIMASDAILEHARQVRLTALCLLF